MAAESALILFPRFQTFIGAGDYTSVPVDSSRFSSLQVELWRGPLIGESATTTFRAYLEESLDGVTWQPPEASARGYDPGVDKSIVLSHIFNLRWFRIRVKVSHTTGTPLPQVTCWAEGLLR